MPYYNIYPEYGTKDFLGKSREDRPADGNPLYSEYIDNTETSGLDIYSRYMKVRVNDTDIIAKYLTDAGTGYHLWFDDKDYNRVYYPESDHGKVLINAIDNIGIYGSMVSLGYFAYYDNTNGTADYIKYSSKKILSSLYVNSGDSYTENLYGPWISASPAVYNNYDGSRNTIDFVLDNPYMIVATDASKTLSYIALTNNTYYPGYKPDENLNAFLVSPLFISNSADQSDRDGVSYYNVLGFQCINDYEHGNTYFSQSYLGVLQHKYSNNNDTTCLYNACNFGVQFNSYKYKYNTVYLSGGNLLRHDDEVPDADYVGYYDKKTYPFIKSDDMTARRDDSCVCSNDSDEVMVGLTVYDGNTNSFANARTVYVKGLGLKTNKPVLKSIATANDEGDILINNISITLPTA